MVIEQEQLFQFVSGKDSTVNTRVSILPNSPPHQAAPITLSKSPVCATVGPWFSILNTAVCVYMSIQTPQSTLSSHPLLTALSLASSPA